MKKNANLQNSEAIQRFRKAIADNPNGAKAYFGMGDAYGRFSALQEQVKNYRKAAQLGVENAQAWLQKLGI